MVRFIPNILLLYAPSRVPQELSVIAVPHLHQPALNTISTGRKDLISFLTLQRHVEMEGNNSFKISMP